MPDGSVFKENAIKIAHDTPQSHKLYPEKTVLVMNKKEL